MGNYGAEDEKVRERGREQIEKVLGDKGIFCEWTHRPVNRQSFSISKVANRKE